MSAKLFENSQNNPNNLINNSLTGIPIKTNTDNFRKLKTTTPDLDKSKSTPISENDSLKILKQAKNNKILIDDRKTNSVSHNRIEGSILSKVINKG